MKITHISTYDKNGGAARAAYRLHHLLLEEGYDSNMLVMKKESDEEKIVLSKNNNLEKHFNSNMRKVRERTQFYKYRNRKNKIFFSYGNIGLDITNHELIKESDILHFHWINDSFININTLKKLKKMNKKIIFTLHDMWFFTGGCHYSSSCDKYEIICEECNILESKNKNDISNKIYNLKKNIYKNLDFDIVTCSKWLEECAKKSSLLKGKKVTTIPNVLDKNIFKDINKNLAREVLNLDKNSIYICFGALNSTSDPRKGFKYLIRALEELNKKYNNSINKNIKLLVFGSSNSKEELPFEATFMGKVYDEYTLSLIYNAADLFIAPSIEDNLPNTVLESLHCKTPVVAFNIGGMPDMIEHKLNGYLAEKENYSDLAKGIDYVINNIEDMNIEIKDNFKTDKIVKQLIEMYTK